MREVILNDKCAHCNHKECHDGEHFCNQAMKENSFYKNSKLYKGLEVIQRPTYEDLEKENAELKADNDARKFAMAMSEKVEKQLRQENAELKAKNEANENGAKKYAEFYFETNDQLAKAKEIMNVAIEGIKYWGIVGGTERPFEKQAEKLFNLFLDKAEQFLSEVEK